MSADNYGQKGMAAFNALAAVSNICIAEEEKDTYNADDPAFDDVS
jgi:hypothetical protein